MNAAPRPIPAGPAVADLGPVLHRALTELLWAHDLARLREQPPWQFAVTLTGLLRAQLTETGLRFLVAEGYVSHGIESTETGASGRKIAPARHLLFGEASCFVLTETGVALANRLSPARPEPPPEHGPTPVRPRWVKAQRTLLWGDRVVLQFQRVALNRERILSAFEAQHWPERLADVAACFAGRKATERLHDAIKNLNAMQCVRLIQFTGDGTGKGVCWSGFPENLALIPRTSP
jgi:hypothetical protein